MRRNSARCGVVGRSEGGFGAMGQQTAWEVGLSCPHGVRMLGCIMDADEDVEM